MHMLAYLAAPDDNTGMMTRILYDEIINVAQDYLGPAAGRFMSSQIQSHLGIEPSQVRSEDIAKLEDWLRVSLSLISNDTASINDFINRLMQLK